MKKSLIFASVLAFVGLFASCQKENVVTPSEPAVEQNVITINTNGFKGEADLEPLEALAQTVVNGEWKNQSIKKSVKGIILDFLRTVGNIIGMNYETPTHTLQYFGDGEKFGYAIDQIRQLSYNLNESEPPFITVQFGNAEELKIGGFEIMPVSHFGLHRGHGNIIEVSDALVVKFPFKGSTYILMIYSAAGNNIESSRDLATGVEFGFEFGEFYISELDIIEVYNEALEEKQFNSINATSSFLELLWDDCPYDSFISSRFTLNDDINNLRLYIGENPDPVVDFSWNDEFEGARFHFGPTFFVYDNEFDLAAMIHFESEVDIVDEANLYTESTTDCKKLIRNFIKAELFGCSKSECESLSKEFDRIFNNDVYVPELDIDTYGNSVKFWGEFYNGSWADVKYVTRLAVGLEAKDMKWKPAFGIRPFGEPSIPIEIEGKFYSFSEIVNMPDEELEAFFKTLSELYKEGSHYIDIIW